VREGRLDRLREALEAVDAADQDVLDAAPSKVVEHGQPELGALGFLPPDPEHLTLAVDGDPEREIAREVSDRAVLADLHPHRVEVDDRIDRIQRPRSPRLDVLEHGVGDATDRVAADLDAVEVGQVRGDVAHRHAAGVEREDLVVQAGQARLALAHQPRFKRPVAVARRLDRDRTEFGLHRLGRVPVAVIAGSARRRLPRRTAQMLGQLGAQRRLDHAPGKLGNQPTGPGDLVRIEPLQRVLQRIIGQQPREPIASLLDSTLCDHGTRRLIPPDIGFLCRHGWPFPAPRAASVTRPHTEHRTDPARAPMAPQHLPDRRTMETGQRRQAHRPPIGPLARS